MRQEIKSHSILTVYDVVISHSADGETKAQEV